MANKDLTSLKVYGNDDPAGSVYTVGGGGGTGGGDHLALKVLYTDPSDDYSGYLAHMDGSDATWQEIYDAVMAGVYVSVIEVGPSVADSIAAISVYAVERVGYRVKYAVVCSSEVTFIADTSTGRLTIDSAT